jgi:hypothetical protein
MQVWRKYNDLYSVSNDGAIRLDVNHLRSKAGKILPVHKAAFGYGQVQIIVNGVRRFKYVHRLVAELFVPVIDEKIFVNHLDGNKLNNNAENLEWCTPLENVRHAKKLGLLNSGSTKIKRRNQPGRPKKYSKAHIGQLLAAYREFGNSAKAGRSLGIKRQYANHLIKKHLP